jgi:hypothetical protein
LRGKNIYLTKNISYIFYLKTNYIAKIKKNKIMNVKKTFQGAIKLSEFVSGTLITKQYIGYSEKEAKMEFRKYCQKIKNNSKSH